MSLGGDHGESYFMPAETSLEIEPSIVERVWKSFQNLLRMAGGSNLTCHFNCSGRGECQNGTCLCKVQYNGDFCMDPNLAYFISFASIFYLIAAVCLCQLALCIRSEYIRMKTPSIRTACRVTTQKFLYLVTFIAAALRGAYFSSPSNADLRLSSSFMSAFYPIILTGGSLLVCFWAEAFHLKNIRCERPRFLSKSFCGFVVFNVINYSLFLTDIIMTQETSSAEERSFLSHVFSGCYAILLFTVLVFFLIYGVEVYFKVRGGFVRDAVIVRNVRSRQSIVSNLLTKDETTDSPAVEIELSETDILEENGNSSANKPEDTEIEMFSGMILQRGVDHSQLHQSRFGLVFQACMLMTIVCFLCSDVFAELWKNKVHLVSRNAYDIVFRIVEIAVAMWFPCCLWNCISPEQLWILNPRKILKPIEIGQERYSGNEVDSDSRGDCWICYDCESTNCGPMIHPCNCKGDVGAVHHDCLRRWLMECVSTNSTENLACKVCGYPYLLESRKVWWIGKGLNARQWFHTAFLVTVMCGTIAGTWTAIHLCSDTIIHALAVGGTLVVINICLRCLGFNTVNAYKRAKMSAVKILSGRFSSSLPTDQANVAVISNIRMDGTESAASDS